MQESQYSIITDAIRKFIYAIETCNQGAYGINKSLLSMIVASSQMRQPNGNIHVMGVPGMVNSDSGGSIDHTRQVFPSSSVQQLNVNFE